MRIFIIFFILLNFLYANTRPKIALVLSGGGARGGAHVGVLKVLKEKHIPIDFIVGTSMGAFVGGLYASGKTPSEIEKMLVTTNWKTYIRTEFVRKNESMRKKETEYQYEGRMALGVDKNKNIILPTGVLKREPMLLKYMQELESVEEISDFDKLPIPFRAVATNIRNGDTVVLKSGSLAHAIYASTAIPGGFQPINIDGIDLVDGGISDNLPIDVAKKMGADIIIAVDVSEDFTKDLDVNSYLVVMGQLVNILMRKNVNKSIATLKDNDILLTPDLNGFSGLDADKYKDIIQRGVDIALKEYNSKLKKLSISKSQYTQYNKQHRFKVVPNSIVINKIEIDNKTNVNSAIILDKLSIKEGDKLNKEKLRQEILGIYDMGVFDGINYKIIEKENQNILKITATPSWNNDGEINFSFGFEDDFSGHSFYSLKAGYTMFGLNTYGGEWKNDIEIGRNKMLYSELYQPLDVSSKYYVRGAFLYHDRDEYIYRTSAVDSGDIPLNIERYGGSIGIGTHVIDNVELEAGISSYQDKIKINLLDLKNYFDSMPVYVSLKTDSLDNLNFPNTGIKSKVFWQKEVASLGSDYDFEQIYFDFEKPFTFDKHNITVYLKYGTTYEQNGANSFASNFSLGGLFNLSGVSPYYLNDENMFLGVVKYRYRLTSGGFLGSLGARVYTGFSLEFGDTWGYHDSANYDSMRKAGSIYFAADTILGPVYFAYGQADSSNSAVYLYLGEKF